jgi:TolA-binding protein
VLGLVLVPLVLGGCVTRTDLMQRDQQVIRFMREQRQKLDAIEREVENLRGDVEGGARPSSARGGSAVEDRLAALEARVYGAEPPADLGALDGSASTVSVDGIDTPPEPSAPAPTGLGATWQTEVAAERAAAVGGPESDEYGQILDMLEGRDCGPAVSKLDDFARRNRSSQLADNALYWAARCYVLMGDVTPTRSDDFYNQAISKFYDVGTTYPKGEKTPPSLWEQGNLFIRLGDVPDARIVFARLIRDYPSSPEAAMARQKLSELEQ